MIGLRLDPALAGRVDASDIVQDVMLEVSQRLADYLRQPTMPFQLWLRHIARDHMIDAHRRHRQAQRRSLDREQSMAAGGLSDVSSLDLAAQFIDREITPASAAVREELQQRMEQSLRQLEEDDREIILMRHYEQLSNQEVATALGLTEAAASMRHLRAVRRLRALLLDE
jgi:RNA polymerase sigma-70 factor (ECF subfamily)